MESLSDTTWDVVLSGTGLSQSLLALSLSRSGKKVLHLDRNDYYGGAEAALSLQEAESWAVANSSDCRSSQFKYATLRRSEQGGDAPKLGFSRAYSISLSPQLIYTRSNLLPALVSSKVYRQLEFLAVGSWWIYNDGEKKTAEGDGTAGAISETSRKALRRIPGGREDVFADKSIDLKSTRSLMKFLKLAADTETHASILEEWGSKPFPEYLESELGIPTKLQSPLLALTLSPNVPADTTTSYALPRIQRHLTSIGMFGPGFGALIPKWGGLAEVTQVACRALAVGGGVYVLNKCIKSIEDLHAQASNNSTAKRNEAAPTTTVYLDGGEQIKTRWLTSNPHCLPFSPGFHSHEDLLSTSRSISVISSTLSQLFPPPAEGSPPPAAVIVAFPTGTLDTEALSISASPHPPIYMTIHSSETGECPTGQSVIYAQIIHPSHTIATSLLALALDSLLASNDEGPSPEILWGLQYQQTYTQQPTNAESSNEHILQLPDIPPSFVLEDETLQEVRAVWERITNGDEGAVFMTFDDREGAGSEEEDGET